MKKFIVILSLIIIGNIAVAQSNTTARGALDAVIKSFSVFDTTVAFKLLSGDLARDIPPKARKDIKESTPEQYAKKQEEDKTIFFTMKVGPTYETDTITAFAVTSKRRKTDPEENARISFLVFKKIKGLWYFDFIDSKSERVEKLYPALAGKFETARLPGQGKPTAKMALDSIAKAFINYDTTAIYNTTHGTWADRMILNMKMRRHSKDWVDKNKAESKILFSTMSVLKTFETDSLTAFYIHYDTPDDKIPSNIYLIFSMIDNLWYFEMMGTKYLVEDFYPALKGKIDVD